MALRFVDEAFPLEISLGATVRLEKRAEVQRLMSGHERRNAIWKGSRHTYDVGAGIRSAFDIHRVLLFFEKVGGRLCGFRFRDPLDHSSGALGTPPSPTDCIIGAADGETAAYQLIKPMGLGETTWNRIISRPVAGSVRVAVGGTEKQVGQEVVLDATTGKLTFQPGHIPAIGLSVTAGFLFDTPTRFDSDQLDISLSHFEAGQLPSIPLTEIIS